MILLAKRRKDVHVTYVMKEDILHLDVLKKGKSVKKIIKMLEEQDLEVLYGEEISDTEEI